MSNKPYSARSNSSQRRKKHTKKSHVGFRLYDEDAELAKEIEDWAPLHDWFTKLLRLARKPTRDYLQALREALDIPVPDEGTEVATLVMDKRTFDRFTEVSKSLLDSEGHEPGAELLMRLALERITPDQIRQAGLDHLERGRAERTRRSKGKPKRG
jgi:hypothetical protein